MKRICLFVAALLLASDLFATEPEPAPETVIISGYVTDFDGNPIDNVTVGWQNPDFTSGQYFTTTDSAGYYCARIPKGRYAYVSGNDFDAYPNGGSTLPAADQRLEYWHWNFIADRDTTADFRFNRMEVYGVNAFHIQGAQPGYTIYFRPMSLTRSQKWNSLGNPAGAAALAPPIDSAKIEVYIDDEPVAIKMRQEVKEYFGEGSWSNGYLLFVEPPKTNRPVKTFHIVLEDLANGDKGEGRYTLEERTDSDYIWAPKGEEIDATYTK